jgi:hypothetical protein
VHESLEPSPPSLPQQSARGSHWDLSVVQIAVTAAIWDLCRLGKLEPWHAIAALVLLAVPGATSMTAAVVSRYISRGQPPGKGE